MIRQIVVEQEDGKPDLVGLLLTSRDLPETESVKLGERLARMEQVRSSESLRGQYKGIRWKWVPVDHVTPGLEFHTIVVPRGTPPVEIGVHTGVDGALLPVSTVCGLPAAKLARALDECDYTRGVSPVHQALSSQILQQRITAPEPPAGVVLEATVSIGGGLETTVPISRGEARAFDRVRARAAAKNAADAGFMYPNRPAASVARAAAIDHRVRRNAPGSPCDRFPAWLWVVATLVVIGVIAAIVSPAFIAGVL